MNNKNILLPADLKPVNSLEEYKSRGGLKGLEKARSLSPRQIIDEIKKAGLRGRGGAGFPAAIKWTTTFEDPCPTKYVVCNGSEGEPGTYKDRYLLQKNPYQLLEGMLIAGRVVDAPNAVIGLKEKFKREIKRVEEAIAEMEQAGVAPEGYFEIVRGPDSYLFGEEKGLLEVIDGRGAMPRVYPPFVLGIRSTPTIDGYNPTIVNNVETLSHVAHILANGAEWFRSFGTEDTPGTMIFTLCGDVKKAGMYELPLGTTLNQLIYDIGGGPANSHPVRAVFSGVANRVMTEEIFDTPMGFGTLRQAGGGLGSAGMIVYDGSMSMLKVAIMFSDFLAKESCGQCVPCHTGCRNITEHLRKFADGRGSLDVLDDIRAECGRVTSQVRCYLPAEESILIPSILEKFPEEFNGRAAGNGNAREPVLPLIDHFEEETRQFTYAPPKKDL